MVFQFSMNYCGISFWGSKFMDVKGYPYPYIYVPTNTQQSVLHSIATNQLPTKLHPNKPAKFL